MVDRDRPENGSFDANLRSVASNTPALVYQFLLEDSGKQSFPYLSDGCPALLGVSTERLLACPELFLTLIQPEDRQSYLESMQISARSMSNWNWEGRVWIESWRDIKWINLRATPVHIPDVGIQWDGLMTNITRGKLAELEILRSRRQLAELSAHIEQVKEEERARIAREIHDDLGGNLTAIKMALAQLIKRLPQTDPATQKVLNERSAYLASLVDRSIEAAHRISSDLRPGILDLGIVAAITWQAKEFQKQTDVPCYVVATDEEFTLPKQHATVLFRIFQEALTNVAKHAHASMVTVHLTMSADSAQLQVSDNGIGIASSDPAKPKSFGIRGMQERVSAMGGLLSVGPGIAGGCLIRACLPLIH